MNTAAIMFFYEHAGSSYNPATQTEVNGRLLGAIALATAHRWARNNGCYFIWENDEPAECQNETGEWEYHPAVSCLMLQYAEDIYDQPKVLGSLGGIIESPDARERQNYRRVVEAELALEAMES